MLSREQGGELMISISKKVYVTRRKEQANPAAGAGIEVALREDRAGMFKYKFSSNRRLIRSQATGIQAAMGGQGVELRDRAQGKTSSGLFITYI